MKREVQPPKSSRSITHATAHKPSKSSLRQIKAQMPVPGASQEHSFPPRPSFQAFPHSPLLPPLLLPSSKHPTSSLGGSTQSTPTPAAHLGSHPRPAAGPPFTAQPHCHGPDGGGLPPLPARAASSSSETPERLRRPHTEASGVTAWAAGGTNGSGQVKNPPRGWPAHRQGTCDVAEAGKGTKNSYRVTLDSLQRTSRLHLGLSSKPP